MVSLSLSLQRPHAAPLLSNPSSPSISCNLWSGVYPCNFAFPEYDITRMIQFVAFWNWVLLLCIVHWRSPTLLQVPIVLWAELYPPPPANSQCWSPNPQRLRTWYGMRSLPWLLPKERRSKTRVQCTFLEAFGDTGEDYITAKWTPSSWIYLFPSYASLHNRYLHRGFSSPVTSSPSALSHAIFLDSLSFCFLFPYSFSLPLKSSFSSLLLP